jgi:hypothetical protein
MSILGKLTSKISEYIEPRIRSIQLTIIERLSFVLSYFVFILILILVGFAVLLFLGFSLVDFFTSLTDSHLAGTLLTVSFYFIIFLIIYFCRKPIINRFAGIFISVLTYKEGEEEEKNTSH